jgi:hypothetical protein
MQAGALPQGKCGQAHCRKVNVGKRITEKHGCMNMKAFRVKIDRGKTN